MATSKASAATPKQISEARELLKELRAAATSASDKQRELAEIVAMLKGLESGIIQAANTLGTRVNNMANPKTLEDVIRHIVKEAVAEGHYSRRAIMKVAAHEIREDQEKRLTELLSGIAEAKDKIEKSAKNLTNTSINFIPRLKERLEDHACREAELVTTMKLRVEALAEDVATRTRERDSARQQCEQLHGILEQTAMAPRLIDRLRWALWGARKAKEGTNAK